MAPSREPAPAALTVRPVAEADESAWRKLWRSYCDFYGVSLPLDVTEATWRRLLDPAVAIFGLVAAPDRAEACGFVHLVLHENTWTPAPVCYLEDLFVVPAARGRSVGRRLIDASIAFATERGCANLYWLTHRGNRRARRLYDSYALTDGMIRYRIPLAPAI